ncbi:hypothetical protein HGA88_00515 [Candidatus Roizmanbacteria bacterium]|nr:hypothetical protein [Candidatus Roizmanbacteria bacterium]
MTHQSSKTQPNLSDSLLQLENTLDEYLGKKAPQLPENAKETLVQFGPWISLIVIIITVPPILSLFSLGAFLSPFAAIAGATLDFNYWISLLFILAAVVFELIALPKLFKREKKGWQYMYYAALITAVGNLVDLHLSSLILGTLLSLYILFQIKKYYK